jgi:hypothetical protein
MLDVVQRVDVVPVAAAADRPRRHFPHRLRYAADVLDTLAELAATLVQQQSDLGFGGIVASEPDSPNMLVS